MTLSCGCEKKQHSYQKKTIEFLKDVEESADDGSSSKLQAEQAIAKLENTNWSKLDEPVVVQFSVRTVGKSEGKVFVVYWVFHNPIAEYVELHLKSGDVITLPIHNDYQQLNRELFASQELMYTTISFREHKVNAKIGTEDIEHVNVY